MTGTDKTIINHELADTPQPVIVLVNPQMGENIGAAARAMLNCGLCHLRIVAPRDGWPNERADATSSGALDLMPPVQVFETTAEAIADRHTVYATTARARDMVKPVLTARFAAKDVREHIEKEQKIAILFGPERAGLANEDVALAHKLITIPLNPGFSSLNLAQGVLLMAYEWSQFVFKAEENQLPTGKSHPATAQIFDEFFDRLDRELLSARFYRVDEMKDIISRNIRSLFQRAQPTDQEISTLHGILSALIRERTKSGE
ncbi:MAG TPA: RNA methyltransferase [Alphaproteobacteria bacterium]|nr:RNA methyltransferase [Alphaproteobacteria bacterium]HNS44071.1 RNA methyltransferase [Alphaproteobacteria bacterium]